MSLGAVNWVKITLRPERIDFYCTTDGASWVPYGTLPRAGLEGAPEWLMLGQGLPGEQPFLANDGQCPDRHGEWAAMLWFDDLIVGRVR